MSEWISIKTALPASGARVIFSWLNVQGKRRTSMGFYARHLEVSALLWDDTEDWDVNYFDFSPNDSGKERPFLPMGWYEEAANGEWFETISDVTHWTPKPEHPKDD